MIDLIKRFLKKEIALVLFLLVLTIPLYIKIIRPGYFPMHDDMQAMRLLQMDKCIKDGQIPCRWVPDMGYGYGYPQFNYYGPLPYYVMEIFHLTGFGYLDSVKAIFVVSIIFSTLAMYFLGKSLWGNLGGFISCLFYAYAPFRAVDMYSRGAVGEFWALIFLPLIFWAGREVLLGKKNSSLWLTLSLAGLWTSHNITTLIFTPLFFAWLIFLFFQIGKPFEKLKTLFVSLIWGFSLSAFFLLPAWFEKGYAHVETLLAGYFNYLAHYVSLGQLLFSTYWGYGSSEIGPYDDTSFAVGLLHWTLPLLIILLFIILRKKKNIKLVFFLILSGWLALFFTHQKSVWFWNKIPILSYLQFPWRFLVIPTFTFSAAAGAMVTLFPKNKLITSGFIGVLILLNLLFYTSYFRPRIWLNITDSDKFSGENWQKELTISIFDYLPIYAKYPPIHEAPAVPEVVNGKVDFSLIKKGTNNQKWTANVLTNDATVRLSLYDFPIWKVWVDGTEVKINHDNTLGLITFSVPSGKHEIFAKLTDTPLRKTANILTLLGIIATGIYLIKKRHL